MLDPVTIAKLVTLALTLLVDLLDDADDLKELAKLFKVRRAEGRDLTPEDLEPYFANLSEALKSLQARKEEIEAGK